MKGFHDPYFVSFGEGSIEVFCARLLHYWIRQRRTIVLDRALDAAIVVYYVFMHGHDRVEHASGFTVAALTGDALIGPLLASYGIDDAKVMTALDGLLMPYGFIQNHGQGYTSANAMSDFVSQLENLKPSNDLQEKVRGALQGKRII